MFGPDNVGASDVGNGTFGKDDGNDDTGAGDEGFGVRGEVDGDDDTGLKFGGVRGVGDGAERLRGIQIAFAELKKKRVKETKNNLNFIFKNLDGNVNEHEKGMS